MDFEGFYSKTLKFLSYRSRSEKEVRDKLIKIKTPEYLINEIIKKLKDYKFLSFLIISLIKYSGVLIFISLSLTSFSEYLINEIIKKLKDYKFLDDLEFAKMFARERSLLKHKPARVIKFIIFK